VRRTVSEKIRQSYRLLHEAWGPRDWWPAETPLEVCVGAILTQNTSWTNVERAIANLKAADVLSVERLWNMPAESLAELIRPAGYFRIKAARLRNFLALLVERYEGRLEKLFELPTERLRAEVLAVSGIGRETADSIVLYAALRPVFVVDAYTYRIAFRHGIVDQDADYDLLQETYASAIEADVQVYNEYHALLVETGKRHCRKQAPHCQGCPLGPLLEEGEPRMVF
jgi:endonuclease III related protein